MSGTKRKAAWPGADAPEKRAHHGADGEGDLDLESQVERQGKARHGRVMTEGYDSEESDDEGAHKRNWGQEKDQDEDDMFAEEGDKKKDESQKKEPRFLKLSEIDGQEFGARTHLGDDDDEEDDEQDPEYELERALRDTRHQDANADAERTPPGSDDEDAPRSKKGMGFKIEQFNMKAEMAGGQFDEEGNYVRNKKDPFAQNDRWLDGNYSKKQIKAANEAQAHREREAKEKADADNAEYPTAEHAMRPLAECLQPGESVLDALQRIGVSAKREKKEGAKGDASRQLDLITHLTSLLMSTFGQMNIYDEMYESLVRQVRRAKLVPEDWDPSRKASEPEEDTAAPLAPSWEYKWTPAYLANAAKASNAPPEPDTKVYGPFPLADLRAWAAQGYFGPDHSHILVRPAGSDAAWHAWAAAGLPS